MNKVIPALLLASTLGACARCGAPADTKAPPPAPAAEARPPAPAITDGTERIVFESKDWTGGRGQCSEGSAAEGCDSEWRHATTSQLVRVFVVPVKDTRALKSFTTKLEEDVRARAGVAEHFQSNGLSVMRFLERARQAVDGGVIEVASLNYALIGRDQKAVHLITSIVPFDDQQPADQRLRELLTHAAWDAPPAP